MRRGTVMKRAGDAILTGGTIVDGTGAPAYPGDVVIQDGRIALVGKRGNGASGENARTDYRIIDCAGCVIAPGFIDAHSHSDLMLLENRNEKLLQGVTCEVVGNCGFSPYPLPEDARVLRDFANGILCGDDHWGWNSAFEYLESAGQSKVATVMSLVGHGALRIKVAGNTSRELTGREVDSMAGLLDEALEQGAVGFSSGLMYAPGSGASPEELIALARVAAKRDKVYATHMRNYSAGLVAAVEEQLAIAEAAGCRLQISHLQAAGEDYWPLMRQAVDMIEAASARGVDVAFDLYPWMAGSTVLTQVLPQDALDGGLPRLMVRLRDAQERESIRRGIKAHARWNAVVITSTESDNSLVGRSVADIAGERGTDPETTVMDILLEQEGNVNIVEHCQSVDNVRELLKHPLSMVITDGVYARGRSHPRLYGTFPLLLGEIVRERKWLGLEEAVNKVTDKPAAAFHMLDRGRIAEGYVADVTVFNPDTMHTDASYEAPDVAPKGIRAVLRNGEIMVDAGQIVYSQ